MYGTQNASAFAPGHSLLKIKIPRVQLIKHIGYANEDKIRYVAYLTACN